MKLRIKGDSLRLRLAGDEVARLAAEGRVTDAIHFGADVALTYTVVADPAVTALQVAMTGGPGPVIEVRVPVPMAQQWCATDAVALQGRQATAQGELRVMVEKDLR